MKSFVMNVWLNTWKELYGEKVVEELISKMNVDKAKLLNPINDVPDDLVVRFSRTLAQRVGKTYEELWQETGYKNIWSFNRFYPGYFQKDGVLSFLSAMDMTHRALTRRIKGARPPRIIYRYIDERTAIVKYESTRDFRSYFLGLLKGAGEFFNDPLNIEVLSQDANANGSFVEVKIIASKPYGKKVTLKLVKIFSIGLMKGIVTSYTFLFPAIVLIASLVFTRFFSPVIASILITVTTLVSSILGLTDLRKGLSAIKDMMSLLKKKDFATVVNVSGVKEFEEISVKNNEAVMEIREFLIGLQGDSEELQNFAQKTMESSKIAQEQIDTMRELASQIADTAIQISNDTERISEAVSSNVETISKTTGEQNKIVQSLNLAVEKIVNSANSVEISSKKIQDVNRDFETIVSKSQDLRNQASEIRNIADTVMGIAEQTNLLALNAAIEAARSGEAGRGFAVVAEEIRKLAEESRTSANQISQFLVAISNGIAELSNGILRGFEELKKQSTELSNSATQSKESSVIISQIMEKQNALIKELNSEVNKLEDVTTSIQNLLAISEESSATAQEISASIQRFLNELNTVFDNVKQTLDLLNLIKENFKELKI